MWESEEAKRIKAGLEAELNRVKDENEAKRVEEFRGDRSKSTFEQMYPDSVKSGPFARKNFSEMNTDMALRIATNDVLYLLIEIVHGVKRTDSTHLENILKIYQALRSSQE